MISGVQSPFGLRSLSRRRLWTPAEINAALWLDADDAGTITQSGGLVSQWRDKSGNGYHAAQGTAVSQPTYVVDGFNERPSVRFSQHFLLQSTARFSLIERSIFVVVNETTAGANVGILSLLPPIGPNSDFSREDAVAVEAGNTLSQQVVFIGSTGASYTLNPSLGSGIASGIYGEVKSAGTGTIFVNGLNSFTDSAFTEFSALSGGGYILGTRWISGAPSPSFVFKGDVAEVVVVGSALSLETRQKLEGYLAHKWGLTANLPATHPYKTARPRA